MFKKNKTILWLTLGAAVLLIGGGAVTYWLLARRSMQLGKIPAGAKLLPQDVLAAASISTDPQQWQQLRQFGTPITQAAFEKQLATLRDTYLTANGYNYQQDIQPWLGKEIMVGWLPSQSPAASSNPTAPNAAAPLSEQSMIMVLPIEDPLKARQLLDKPRPNKAGKFVERTYKGVQIRETQKSSTQNISTMVLGRLLVVTTDPKTTERAIDTYQGGVSVATTPGYAEALGKIQANKPFAQLYFNVPKAAALAAVNSASGTKSDSKALSPESLAQAQQKQGIATTVTIEPQGMRFRGISWLKPNSQNKFAVENNAENIAKRLPSETLLMMSGGNLQQLWKDYKQGAESNPLTPINPEIVRSSLKSTTNLDLEQDLLPWMKGEFSLSIIPKPPKTPSDLGAGIVLMVEASDRAQAEKTFDRLDEVMAKQYQFQVKKTDLKGKAIVNWTSQLGGLNATHGWLDGNVAFLTLGAPIAEAIVPKPQATLADNELYKKTVPTDLSPNNGQFFIDLDRTINAGNLSFLQLPPAQKILLNGITALGVTGAIEDDRSSRFDIFATLKKSGQAAPSISPGSSPALPPASGTPKPSP